ncbi:BTB/POZ domain protein [Rhizoctonia solani AG-3 Rhs1AP]|uniref:BTB/POZ domain protein n=1 Tax=Rhizoctonia solani AG-3 Rhs1AP TaxID=1086054 RepID=X8JQR5_9AGAM|nr:BTB/POZ domain protein [Rhizoctonia solani AG-3 Rhs1AP]
MPTAPSETTAPFAFQPPVGGDIVLKSCEGTIFNAHSILLGLASTVFAGMFDGASKADTVELAEDAETISLMLAFIYPVTPPSVTSVEQLEKIMLFSQKYDISKMIDYVEKLIRPGNELVHSDPVRLFRASMKYGFPAIKSLSARAFYPKHCDLLTAAGFVKLARRFSEASSVIGLIGAQVIMSGDFAAVTVATRPPFVFQPPTDGDLTLQSCDGTIFQVHSVLIGLASTVLPIYSLGPRRPIPSILRKTQKPFLSCWLLSTPSLLHRSLQSTGLRRL